MLKWPIILSLITYIYTSYTCRFAPRQPVNCPLRRRRGYNLHVGDGSFQGVYTRLTCTGLVRGGRGPRAISRLLMCCQPCAGPQMRWVWRSGPHCTGTLARRRCPEALHSAVLDDSLAEDVALELMRLGDEVRRRRAARRAAPVLCEKLLTCGEHRLRLLGELLLHLSRNLGL